MTKVTRSQYSVHDDSWLKARINLAMLRGIRTQTTGDEVDRAIGHVLNLWPG